MSSEVDLMAPVGDVAEAGVSLIDCDDRTAAGYRRTGFPYIGVPPAQDGHAIVDGVMRIAPGRLRRVGRRRSSLGANDVLLFGRCNSGAARLVPIRLDCAIGQEPVVMRSNGADSRTDVCSARL